MVHSTKSGTAKIFTKKELDEWNEMLRKRSRFTDYEISWYGLRDSDGYKDQERKNLTVDIQPIDPRTKRKKDRIDIREETVVR